MNPRPQNLGFFDFFVTKTLHSKEKSFYGDKLPKFEYQGVFVGGESIGSIILDAWMGPSPQNLDFGYFLTPKVIEFSLFGVKLIWGYP